MGKNNKKSKKKKKSNAKWLYISLAVILIAVIAAVCFFTLRGEDNSKVLFTMENGDTFTVELYPKYAPETVKNFKELVDDGFYDGLTFHRVVEGFMAQGGSPNGDGTGDSGKTIKGEFAQNGFSQNTLSHQRGVISMARTNEPDSASSGFFICYDDASFLDGQYAAFGKVIEGMETIDKFLEVERTQNELGEIATPVTPIRIKSAKIIQEGE